MGRERDRDTIEVQTERWRNINRTPYISPRRGGNSLLKNQAEESGIPLAWLSRTNR